MTTVELDDSKSDQLFRDLQQALYKSGAQSDMPHIVNDEARFLANKCVNICGPKSAGRLKKKIEGEISTLFTEVSDLPGVAVASGNGEIKWLNAGHNFLFGLPQAYDVRDHADIYQDYKVFRQAGGKRLQNMGSRGKQTVSLINRFVGRKGSVRDLKKKVVSHIGRLKASFADSAIKLGASTFPEWITRHLPSPRSILIKDLESATPSVTIGSRSPGCEYHAEAKKKALKSRMNSMKARTRLIWSNYSRKVAAGIRPNFSAGETYASD